MVPISKRKWYGSAGHFVCRERCLFHLHTHVGNWCISTIGEFYERWNPTGPQPPMMHLGSGIGKRMYYETMVYAIHPHDVIAGIETEAIRYRTLQEADTGHTKMCKKYAGLIRSRNSDNETSD